MVRGVNNIFLEGMRVEGENRRFFSSKGLSPLLTMLVLIFIMVIAFALVLGIGNPLIETTQDTSRFDEAEDLMEKIDSAVKEVVQEGTGAKRLLKVNLPAELEFVPAEDAAQLALDMKTETVEYLSRRTLGNLVEIAGGDVSCDERQNLTLENTFLRAELRRIPLETPHRAFSTADLLLSVKEKKTGVNVTFVNTSFVIDDNLSSLNGTGYTEILRRGTSLPSCTVHAFVNATVDYDAYYTLHAGADFLVIDVRNLR